MLRRLFTTIILSTLCLLSVLGTSDGQQIYPSKLYTLGTITSINFSPTGKVLVAAEGLLGGRIDFWDVPQGTKRTLTTQTGEEIAVGIAASIEAVALSPDGLHLATSIRNDKRDHSRPYYQLKMYDTQMLTLERPLQVKIPNIQRIYNITFSPDAKTVVGACWQDESTVVVIWDVGTGEIKKSFRVSDKSYNPPPIAFSPNGELVACMQFVEAKPSEVAIWNLATGELKTTIEESATVRTLAFSSDSALIVGGTVEIKRFPAPTVMGWRSEITGGKVKLWNAQTGKLQRSLLGYDNAVHLISFSPDGKTLAITSRTSTQLWDLAKGELKAELNEDGGATVITFSPDSKTMAIGDGNIIKLRPLK